jgi:hypothetical protein
MEEVNRRSAIGLSMTGALFALTTPAVAQEYGPNDGKELSPVSVWLKSEPGTPISPPIRKFK